VTSIDLETLVARAQILDCIHRYCRGVDRLDEELILSAYHPDAIDWHGNFAGSPPAFVEQLFERHAGKFHVSQHHITNHLVLDLHEDIAHTESYWFVVLGHDSETLQLSGGRYVDRFERREGEWRIAHRVVLVEWRAEPAAKDTAWPSLDPTRDRSDPSYTRPLGLPEALAAG